MAVIGSADRFSGVLVVKRRSSALPVGVEANSCTAVVVVGVDVGCVRWASCLCHRLIGGCLQRKKTAIKARLE